MSGASTRSSLPVDGAHPRLLFVDPDREFLELLKRDRKAAIIAPLTAENGAKAIEILLDAQIELSAVFVGQDTQGPDCLSVIRRAKQLRPTLPVMLVYPGEHCAIEPSILDKMGNCQAIPRNFTYGGMARKFFPPELLFEPSDALEKSSHDETPVGHEHDHVASDYMPIRADSFMSGKKAFFDLFVKVGPKLIKILKANDDFTRDRLEAYLSKGVEYFYIRKETQQEYLAYSHKLTSAIVSHPAVQPEVKINHTLSGGEAVLAYLRQKDRVDPEQLRFAESYVRLVETLISELGLDRQDSLVAAILRNPEMREHAVGATILSGLVAHQLGFETKKSAALLGIGCLLHDAGLPEGLQEVELIPEEKLDDVQRRAYLEHPLRGAQLVAGIPGLSPVVGDIVSNHHRRRDGSGFPNPPGLSLSKVTVPVEIVGATDEIVRLFTTHMSTKTADLHRQVRLNILPVLSADVATAIRIVLKIEDEE